MYGRMVLGWLILYFELPGKWHNRSPTFFPKYRTHPSTTIYYLFTYFLFWFIYSPLNWDHIDATCHSPLQRSASLDRGLLEHEPGRGVQPHRLAGFGDCRCSVQGLAGTRTAAGKPMTPRRSRGWLQASLQTSPDSDYMTADDGRIGGPEMLLAQAATENHV